MGSRLVWTTQVSASECYLHDLPSTYTLIFKEVLGRGQNRRLFPVTRNFSMCNKIIDKAYGAKESHDVKSSRVVSIKTETVPATTKFRIEVQEVGMREAMAALMKIDNKDLNGPNQLRAKKVKFRDEVGTSAQCIIRRAEFLIADSSVKVS